VIAHLMVSEDSEPMCAAKMVVAAVANASRVLGAGLTREILLGELFDLLDGDSARCRCALEMHLANQAAAGTAEALQALKAFGELDRTVGL